MRATYLVHLSALSRVHHPDVHARVEPLLVAGRLATTAVADLELLRRARRPEDHRALAADRRAVPHVPLGDGGVERALEVQALLAAGGRHRAVDTVDLLVAAAAERAGLALLHYDRVFDLVSEVTGQPAVWVVPPGTLG